MMISCRSTRIVEEAKIKQPNILLLLSDDQSFNTINALGNKEVSTPNMDRLVSEGTAFTHAHIMGGNTGAICMPSRAMMMTGKNVQKFNNQGALTSEDETMPQLLKEAGYTTFGTGKWHNNRDSYSRSFTHGSNIFLCGMSNNIKVPLQDFDQYGKAFGGAKILSLDTKNYIEESLFEVQPNFFSNITATHTFNYVNGLAVIDFVEIKKRR